MTHHDHIMSVYRRQNDGKIPWAAYGGFLVPAGANERTLRNQGCGWLHWTEVCSWMAPGMSHMNGWMVESQIRDTTTSVQFKWNGDERVIVRRYDTPVGSVSEELHREPGFGSLWVKKFLIESPEDYAVVKFMVEHSVFRENYHGWMEARDNLGHDGVELAVIDRSPFQKMLLELCGTERLYMDLYTIPEAVEDLLETMRRKELEAIDIVAQSPADVVWMVDNVTGVITEPSVFEKYCLPFYNEVADRVHATGKVLAVHLDGALKPIKDLIAASRIDVVESFSLPEVGGDMSIEEAFATWPGKAVVASIPANLAMVDEPGIRRYLGDFFERLPSRNFMFEVSENFPSNELRRVLPIFADVVNAL
jgi:hypothetical protein